MKQDVTRQHDGQRACNPCHETYRSSRANRQGSLLWVEVAFLRARLPRLFDSTRSSYFDFVGRISPTYHAFNVSCISEATLLAPESEEVAVGSDVHESSNQGRGSGNFLADDVSSQDFQFFRARIHHDDSARV